MKKPKIKQQPISKVIGVVTKTPVRVTTKTKKIMSVMTIEAHSDKRSNYPLKVIGFDELALDLMLCKKGQEVAITGKTSYRMGYQIVVKEVAIP